MDQVKLKQIIEAAILASGKPLTIEQLTRLFERNPPERTEIREALAALQADCTTRGVELREVATGYRFQVRDELSEWVNLLWEDKPPRYSRALLETLALIAYRQPITRGDIEEIRGVSVSSSIMRSLLEREWVRIVGHRDVPGRPAMYATTRTFLDYFNLRSLDELPTLSEIRDLDKINEELDLNDAPSPERELDLADEKETRPDTGQAQDAPLIAVGMPAASDDEIEEVDEDLEGISRKVSDIEENIRAFMGRGDDNAQQDEMDQEADVEMWQNGNENEGADTVQSPQDTKGDFSDDVPARKS